MLELAAIDVQNAIESDREFRLWTLGMRLHDETARDLTGRGGTGWDGTGWDGMGWNGCDRWDTTQLNCNEELYRRFMYLRYESEVAAMLTERLTEGIQHACLEYKQTSRRRRQAFKPISEHSLR